MNQTPAGTVQFRVHQPLSLASRIEPSRIEPSRIEPRRIEARAIDERRDLSAVVEPVPANHLADHLARPIAPVEEGS